MIRQVLWMENPGTTTMNRRTILKTTGSIALAGLAAGGHATAQTDLPVDISQNPEAEFITITNTGDEDLDLTGYRINFDAEGGNDQIREIAGDVVIPAGGEITIATGAQTTVDTDYELTEPYDGYVLNNDGTDRMELLDPEGNAVVSGDETSTEEPDSGEDDDGAGSDEDDDDASEEDADDGTSDDSSADDESESEDGESDDEPEDSESEDAATTDDGSSDSDAKEDYPDETNSEDETDADNDGVAASEDADDDCAKVS